MTIRPPILCALLLAALLLAGCAPADQPAPTTTVAVSQTALTTSSTGPMSFAAPLAADITPVSVFAALNTYWSAAYRGVLGAEFIALRGGEVPLDSGEPTGGALCISSPGQLSGNAYYCPDEDGIVYDIGVLIPVLIDHYGPVGLLSSLAHEYGHAVAARLGVAGGAPMVRELQADCLAGSFLAWAVSPDAPFGLYPDAARPALAPLLDFGDQPDTKPDAATAHGMALDRAQAVRLGYLTGPTGCRDMTAASISVVLGRVPGPTPAGARFDSDLEVTRAALDSARETVGADLPAATPPTADAAAAHVFGDFALATAAVLTSADEAGLDEVDAGCLTGRWVAAVYGTVGPDELGGRAADADQALNFVRTRPDASADSMFGFVDGFAGRC